MERGTEAFPDLGQHCQHEDCNQLDFLPFTCAGCRKVFCLDHRTYKSHGCPRAEQHSRTVVVCEACSTSIEKQAGAEDGDEEAILEQHVRSGDCHPDRKKRPRCPVGRCKEVLTFSNSTTCKMCTHKVCLKHRFPSDHDCSTRLPTAGKSPVSWPARNGTDCGDKRRPRMPTNPPPIKAC